MKDNIRMIAVLTVIGLMAGLVLALVFRYADPLITDNLKKETENAIFQIFSDAKSYSKEKEKDESVFKVKDAEGKLLGYAFLAAGDGYQGKIKMMAGIKPDLETLAGIEILESQETPGLGQEITTAKFKQQFNGLEVYPEIEYVKNKKPDKPNEIEAITGATISSRSVVSILNDNITRIKEELSK